MDAMTIFALLGLGAFLIGLAVGFSYGRRHPFPLDAADDPPAHTFHCPTCKRERKLPAGLGGRVLVCNLCQVRLKPGAAEPEAAR